MAKTTEMSKLEAAWKAATLKAKKAWSELDEQYAKIELGDLAKEEVASLLKKVEAAAWDADKAMASAKDAFFAKHASS